MPPRGVSERDFGLLFSPVICQSDDIWSQVAVYPVYCDTYIRSRRVDGHWYSFPRVSRYLAQLIFERACVWLSVVPLGGPCGSRVFKRSWAIFFKQGLLYGAAGSGQNSQCCFCHFWPRRVPLDLLRRRF